MWCMRSKHWVQCRSLELYHFDNRVREKIYKTINSFHILLSVFVRVAETESYIVAVGCVGIESFRCKAAAADACP